MNSISLKSGFTTGTCAQAAAKASAMMLINQKALDQIEVEKKGKEESDTDGESKEGDTGEKKE